ncbi:hypothetical protein PIB30_092536, partial [Stylosanthes scabra]|nr:hypothetical protein [Stylosanthes scabra]
MEEIQRRTKRRKIEERQNRAKAPRICVEEHAYACYINSSPRLSNSVTLRRGNQAHPLHAYAWISRAHIPRH